MGFLSKTWKKIKKGVKKVVKKVAKTVKKVVKKVGKFVGKLGIVGQIGLSLLLPGIGSMLGGTAGWLMKASSPLLKGAGKFLNAAMNVGTKVGNVFKTITSGVTKVVGHVVGSAANALGLDVPFKNLTAKLGMGVDGKGIDISNKHFSDTFKVVGEQASKFADAGKDLFSMDTLTGEHELTKAYLDKQDAKYTKYGAKAVSDQLDVNIDPETGKPIVKKIELPDAEGDSLLSKEAPKKTFKEAIKDLPGKMKEATIEGIEELPGTLVSSVLSAPKDYIETAVEGAALKEVGAISDTNVFNAAVPTIDTGTTDIGTGGYETGFNPNMYTSNINYISQNPYGQTATLHNAYQNYMRGAV
jgi:hypothetical protein